MANFNLDGLPPEFFMPGELEVFLNLVAQHRPASIVEFGVQRGRNPKAVLQNFDFVTSYVGVDVPPDFVTAQACQRGEVPAVAGELAAGYEQYRTIIRPRGSFDLTAAALPAADFIFIDGDHSAAGVRNDRALALSIARPGAVILYHDDNGRAEVQVTETLQEFRKAGATIEHINGTWFAIEIVGVP